LIDLATATVGDYIDIDPACMTSMHGRCHPLRRGGDPN
jgi:hypothetical protein